MSGLEFRVCGFGLGVWDLGLDGVVEVWLYQGFEQLAQVSSLG